jgi:hypothetical protein
VTAAHPLPAGTRVRHYGQQWPAARRGTATIVDAKGPYNDGSWEYLVLAGADFSRATGPDNPETREAWWSSLAVISVAAEVQPPEVQAEDSKPVCEGFQWVGQSFAICERCGQPAWEHAGEELPAEGADPFDTRRTVRPWKPGEADAIRAKWSRRTP